MSKLQDNGRDDQEVPHNMKSDKAASTLKNLQLIGSSYVAPKGALYAMMHPQVIQPISQGQNKVSQMLVVEENFRHQMQFGPLWGNVCWLRQKNRSNPATFCSFHSGPGVTPLRITFTLLMQQDRPWNVIQYHVNSPLTIWPGNLTKRTVVLQTPFLWSISFI